MSGTMRVLAHVDGPDLFFLGWENPPITARVDGRDLLGEVNFGDEDCDPFPVDCPDEIGLWLLTWDYEYVRFSEWGDGRGDGDMGPKFSPTCSWTRPTLDDLVALGALPQVAL